MLSRTSPAKPALSLIEVMVAVAIVSFVLIALVSNIFYTQRVIIDARLRAKAIDQANSCLERFRNLRDGMLWWQFYQRLDCHCVQGKKLNETCMLSNSSSPAYLKGDDTTTTYQDKIKCEFPFTIPAYDILNRPAGKYADNPVPSSWEIGPDEFKEWKKTNQQSIDDTICGQPPVDIAINNFGYHGQYQVKLNFDPNINGQKITVAVTVQYQDYRGKDRQVTVSEQFAQDPAHELPLKSS